MPGDAREVLAKAYDRSLFCPEQATDGPDCSAQCECWEWVEWMLLGGSPGDARSW